MWSRISLWTWLGSAWSCLVLARNDQKTFSRPKECQLLVIEPWLQQHYEGNFFWRHPLSPAPGFDFFQLRRTDLGQLSAYLACHHRVFGKSFIWVGEPQSQGWVNSFEISEKETSWMFLVGLKTFMKHSVKRSRSRGSDPRKEMMQELDRCCSRSFF